MARRHCVRDRVFRDARDHRLESSASTREVAPITPRPPLRPAVHRRLRLSARLAAGRRSKASRGASSFKRGSDQERSPNHRGYRDRAGAGTAAAQSITFYEYEIRRPPFAENNAVPNFAQYASTPRVVGRLRLRPMANCVPTRLPRALRDAPSRPVSRPARDGISTSISSARQGRAGPEPIRDPRRFRTRRRPIVFYDRYVSAVRLPRLRLDRGPRSHARNDRAQSMVATPARGNCATMRISKGLRAVRPRAVSEPRGLSGRVSSVRQLAAAAVQSAVAVAAGTPTAVVDATASCSSKAPI